MGLLPEQRGWMEYVGSFFTQDRNENWKDIIKMMAREQEEEEDSLSLPLSLN